ncbi:transcription elongation factor GreB [Ectothiorhodospira mobilis]|uniref:transcription elongation factor GreB n=1 Tax=Ectothiorhodospira mobilis TaxID=195064 RepID=UPI001EE8819E|nr:transcription elongation factor GreB [Ectothiorhodospira mobilis]MCG5535998.1 transcription elongation factor GreB [Ectothiorhodospira mobilis]
MSRWRPPSPRSSPYITPEGHATLEAELDGLWTRRADVTRHLAAAAAEGDRSENAEYIYRKKELREIDRRIRYLQKRIPDLKVVRDAPADRDRVFFGARVTLADADGREVIYRIVGADEFDPERGWISVDSPVARALLGRHLDDEVEVHTPGGVARYEVVEIAYPGAGE